MADDQVSDEQLVRAFQNGDRTAFDTFLGRHKDRLYRLASVWLYDPSQASDATQEVFLRSVHGMPTFRFTATPFTWLYRTLRLVCHEFNRQKAFVPAVDEAIQSGPTVRETYDHERGAHAVRELVQQLPTRQRDVVLLRVFEGMSVRDTARAMACREGTVKALLSKAKASLRRRLEPHP